MWMELVKNSLQVPNFKCNRCITEQAKQIYILIFIRLFKMIILNTGLKIKTKLKYLFIF